ncbi:hypothetical protein ACFPK9_11340 [Rubritalea spongiae]|uniref:Uncharacterized protein n=1 Tax=Rubritalea spongiae TaxID=430797 RepID=A0ABW5DY52_9BACT
MENPHQTPQSTPQVSDEGKFASTYRYLKLSISSAISLIIVGLIACTLALSYNLTRLATISMGVSGIGLAMIALALLVIIPFIMWGFQTGVKEAKRNIVTLNTKRHSRDHL